MCRPTVSAGARRWGQSKEGPEGRARGTQPNVTTAGVVISRGEAWWSPNCVAAARARQRRPCDRKSGGTRI